MSTRDLKNLSEVEARKLLEMALWPEGPVCPHCGNCDQARIGHIAENKAKKIRAGLKQCKECRKQFTVTSNTVFASSKLPIATWVYIIASMCSSKKGVSALQLQRELGDHHYEAIWFACHRVRHAMALPVEENMMGGVIHADEAYVGGKPRNKGNSKRGLGTNKQPITTLVERDGDRAYTRVVCRVTKDTLHSNILSVVRKDSTIMTDENFKYRGIGKHFTGGHHSVSHKKGEYSRDGVSSNTAESVFAIIKRSVYGIHHHYSKEHMQHYLNERDFMWTNRKSTDVQRAHLAIKGAEGKRLMYKKPKRGFA